MSSLRTYYSLTKPGLIYGNILTIIGGYLYGAALHPKSWGLVGVAIGGALVMASGTVINNVHDRTMDKHMKRTKKRALVTGLIKPMQAVLYAIVLAAIGLGLLVIATNPLTVTLGVIGLVSYAAIYTYAKPRTVHATLIGTIPGTVPILAGYAAATNRIDASFWVLFSVMVCWQMAHFYAIATFRMQDYKTAKVPVITVVKGVKTTQRLMTMFVGGYLLSILSLAYIGYAGVFYLAIMAPLALWWFIITARGWQSKKHDEWARKVFFISLLLLPALCFTLALNALVP